MIDALEQSEPEPEYLDATGVAARIGVKRKTIWEYVRRREIPEPDLWYLGKRLWLVSTIDAWRKQRYMRRHKRPPLDQPDVTVPRRPPRMSTARPGARMQRRPRSARKRTSVGALEKPASCSISETFAAEVALELRAAGLTCTTADVMVLVDHDDGELDHDREVLRKRVVRLVNEKKEQR